MVCQKLCQKKMWITWSHAFHALRPPPPPRRSFQRSPLRPRQVTSGLPALTYGVKVMINPWEKWGSYLDPKNMTDIIYLSANGMGWSEMDS